MATHSSVLAWRILGMGKSGGLLSLRSHRVGHDWSDLAAVVAGERSHCTAHTVRVRAQSLSHVRLCVTPQTIAHQAPLSMGFPRQESWNGLPFPSPGDLPNPGIKPMSPAWQADLSLSHLGIPQLTAFYSKEKSFNTCLLSQAPLTHQAHQGLSCSPPTAGPNHNPQVFFTC